MSAIYESQIHIPSVTLANCKQEVACSEDWALPNLIPRALYLIVYAYFLQYMYLWYTSWSMYMSCLFIDKLTPKVLQSIAMKVRVAGGKMYGSEE